MKTQSFTILVVVPFTNFASCLNSEIWAFYGQRKIKPFFPEISLVVFRESDHTGQKIKKTIVTVVVNFSEPEERDSPFSSLKRGLRTRGKTHLYGVTLSEVKM